MKTDTYVLGGIGLLLVTTIGWAAWEKRVENEQNYLSLAEQVHEKERQFHRQVGETRALLERYHLEIEDFKRNQTLFSKQIGEIAGKVELLRDYFTKYSPENFDKEVKKVYSEMESAHKSISDILSIKEDVNDKLKDNGDKFKELSKKIQDNEQKLSKMEKENQLSFYQKLVQYGQGLKTNVQPKKNEPKKEEEEPE